MLITQACQLDELDLALHSIQHCHGHFSHESAAITYRLGHGAKCLSADLPQIVAALRDRSMTALSCGASHTAAVEGGTLSQLTS